MHRSPTGAVGAAQVRQAARRSRRSGDQGLDAEETGALNTLALELTDLYRAPGRFDQRQATLWTLLARETEAAERRMDEMLAPVREAMDRGT